MKTTFLTYFCLIFFTTISFTQNKNECIKGKWKRVEQPKKELQIEIGNNNSSSKSIEVTLTFQDNNIIKIKQGPQNYEAKYQLNDNILFLGNRKYQILKLNNDSLVMKDNHAFLPVTYKYFRIISH